MSDFVIENPRNGRIREVARLRKRAERVESGLFLLEGPQSLREALSYRPETVFEIFATPTAWEKHTDVRELAEASDHDIELVFVTEQVLDALADTVTPQGMVAVARQIPTALKDIFTPEVKLIAVCEEVRDPGNLGTIIRAADAAGADAVVLTGRTVDLFNSKVVRSTTGSLYHLPIAVGGDLADVITRAHAAGLIATAADVKGADFLAARNSGELAQPRAWVFGNEARGLSDEALALCDDALRIPIFGEAESLNLATAASVCLYETAFAQRSAG